MTGVRITAIQAAPVTLAALIAAWRSQLSPREYAALLDIAARIIEREQERAGRWAA